MLNLRRHQVENCNVCKRFSASPNIHIPHWSRNTVYFWSTLVMQKSLRSRVVRIASERADIFCISFDYVSHAHFFSPPNRLMHGMMCLREEKWAISANVVGARVNHTLVMRCVGGELLQYSHQQRSNGHFFRLHSVPKCIRQEANFLPIAVSL